MQSQTDNIFQQVLIAEESPFFETLTNQIKTIASAIVSKTKDIVSEIKFSNQTTQKISIESERLKQLLKQNKQAILGISLVTLLFIVKQKMTEKKRKQERSRHIHTLTSSPHHETKRSSSNKQKTKSGKRNQNRKFRLQLLGASKFISQEDQFQCTSQEVDCHQVSSSTRRTQSIVSDAQLWNRKKPKKLQPILDEVEEQEQQDRVFFQMYRTYRQA